jgi:drug/metabolite transporter (DMT)-like permease
MPFGLLTGLGAALSWGTMDVATALASRVIGSVRVTAGVQLVSAFLIVAFAILTATPIPSDPTALSISALLGVVGAAAYVTYFTGLSLGPISVVSGMVAAYGGLTVVLAVVIRGESLTAVQAVGAAIATTGVILTGVAFEGGLRGTHLASPGVIFAIVALVLFAGMTIVGDIALDSAGWIQVVLVSRIVNASISVLAVVILALRDRMNHVVDDAPGIGGGRSRTRIIGLLLIAGTLDIVGLASFAIGLETAPTWLVGLASSFGPAITILVAVAFLGERLKPIQWVGLVGVAIGMIAIGLP